MDTFIKQIGLCFSTAKNPEAKKMGSERDT